MSHDIVCSHRKYLTSLCFTDGQLRNIETGEPFLFEVKKGKKAYNQAHYEALGEVSVLGLLWTLYHD